MYARSTGHHRCYIWMQRLYQDMLFAGTRSSSKSVGKMINQDILEVEGPKKQHAKKNKPVPIKENFVQVSMLCRGSKYGYKSRSLRSPSQCALRLRKCHIVSYRDLRDGALWYRRLRKRLKALLMAHAMIDHMPCRRPGL